MTAPAPRATSESATANGIAPPPAMMPTGEEISRAAEVMVAAVPFSMPKAVVGRKTERAVLAVADESENFRNRGVLLRHRLHRVQPFGKDAGPVKQLLIERAHRSKPLARELAALHADEIEAFER